MWYTLNKGAVKKRGIVCSRQCSGIMRGKKLNSGDKFGKLTYIEDAPSVFRDYKCHSFIQRMAKCKCDCGNEVVVVLDSLSSGNTKSCGCAKRSVINGGDRKYNPLRLHQLYGIWSGMCERCYNKNCHSYRWYGAKGVKICKEWRNDYNSFYYWAINNGWQKGLELDKDIKGSGKLYSPKYCMFVTHAENNEAHTKYFIEIKGCVLSAKKIGEAIGVNPEVIRHRLRNKKPVDDIIKKYIENAR